jgi:hypothetical protein
MAVFGYARVSTDGQTLASQDAELMAAGYIWFCALRHGAYFLKALKVRGNRTGKGYFVKGRSGNPAGRPKTLPEFASDTDDPDGADRRAVGNLVTEARKFSGLARAIDRRLRPTFHRRHLCWTWPAVAGHTFCRPSGEMNCIAALLAHAAPTRMSISS